MNSRLRQPIQLASGPIRLHEVLGRGSAGEVWSVSPVEKHQTEAELVLKVGRPEVSRFIASETKRLALACSSALPVPIDVGRLPKAGLPFPEWCGAPYLLMTRLPGDSLSQVIEEPRPLEERVHLALAVARDVGNALADLHEANVAHGDVKPNNVLVERDAASEHGWRAGLCDLGLSAVGEQWLGATPKYLPPEFHDVKLGASTAKARDLWALGVTLLETLQPAAALPEVLLSNPRVLESQLELPLFESLPATLRRIVTGLLSPSAAARTRARWVSSMAGNTSQKRDHALAIRRHYLAAHGEFLECIAEGKDFEIAFDGQPGEWLRQACDIMQRLPTVFPDVSLPSKGPKHTAKALTLEERRRMLVALCGLPALDFPPSTALSETEFVERLTAAARIRAPGAFTPDLFGDHAPVWLRLDAAADGALNPSNDAVIDDDEASFSPSAFSPTASSLVAVALDLGSEQPSPQALIRAERLTLHGHAPLAFSLQLSSVLKRRGELGRARAVLLPYSESEARVALAGVLARSGAVDEALTLCASYVNDDSPDVAAGARALKARLHLSRGELADAQAILPDSSFDPRVLEARASLALSLQDLRTARALLLEAQGLPCVPEQRSRLHALLAHLDHQVGDHEAAFRGYQKAAADAMRAGAILEEATYLVGVASTAANLARTSDALAALDRAELLFEIIDNPAARARATLNRASCLNVVGAVAEASSAAELAALRASRVKDARCEAWAHLLLASHRAPPLASEHLSRARSLLTTPQPHELLRVQACALLRGLPVDTSPEEWDQVSASCGNVEAQLEWWTARARQLTQLPPSSRGHAPERVLTALTRLMTSQAPVDIVGQAYAAGAELAATTGDGERTLQFIALAREAHQQIVAGAPRDLQLTARQLPWTAWFARHSSEATLRPEQIHEVERLVKELADRSHLRVVLERSLDALIRWTGVERGLLLMNAPGGKLVPRAARNLARQSLSPEHQQLSQTLARQALDTGDCVVAVDASGELPALHQSVHALKLRSVLAVPLIARGETVGVVYLDDRMRRGAFGDSELAWVRLVGTIAAVAIFEARDQALLKRAARRASRAEKRLAAHLDLVQTELSAAKVALAKRATTSRHGLIGSSAPMLALHRLIERVGPSEISALILGESGTGKELVARALHRASPRSDKAFVTENCGAIPEPLLESILFGHKRGAFTGAVQTHVGLFEAASGGTLFLDELGEMSLPMQAKLLRVLETGELRRVGDDRVVRVDVRVVAASHRDLERMVAQGAFREDLYYRLNVITIPVPPLRNRLADIPELVQHFLGSARKGRPMPIDPAALAALAEYHWPGNVRQLENELRRATVLADNCIRLEHLSPALTTKTTRVSPIEESGSLNLRERVDALETQLIERALREAAGNQSRAAESLGVSRFGLQKMLKRLNIAVPK